MMFPRVLWDDRVRVRLRMLISQSLGRKEPNVERMGRVNFYAHGGSSAKTELVL